jgi:tetratricopeptide (TPR) repeat protein
MKSSLSIVLVLLGCAVAVGDVIHLKDGTSVEGEVRKQGQFWVITKEDGTIQHVGQDRVRSVEVTQAELTPERAEARLASLRRSVRNLRDLEQIIERYERFVESAEGTPAAEEAAEELAVWRQRLEQDMVRIADEWVTREQRAELQQEVLAVAGEARQLIRQGRLDEAEALLERALEIDPGSATAWYLKGVLRYRQDQIAQARRAFETTRDLLADHGPTYNNLAVILWRQNQHVAAMNHYDQAMVAAPRHQQILDNVAEALAAMPREMRQRPVVQRANRRFVEQDAQLQEQLRAQGLYRWGATWVTQEQLEQLRREEQRIQAELDRLAMEYDATQARIRRIGRDIESAQTAMRQIATTRWARDVEGRLIWLPLPASYYELERDVRRLEDERAEAAAQLETLPAEARAVEQSRPVPRHAGVQRLIGEEAAPVVPPDVKEAGSESNAQEQDGPGSVGAGNAADLAPTAGSETNPFAVPRPVPPVPEPAPGPDDQPVPPPLPPLPDADPGDPGDRPEPPRPPVPEPDPPVPGPEDPPLPPTPPAPEPAPEEPAPQPDEDDEAPATRPADGAL